MNKKDEIDLRHKFEAVLRHEGGFSLKLKGNGTHYEDPNVESMWQIIKLREHMPEEQFPKHKEHDGHIHNHVAKEHDDA